MSCSVIKMKWSTFTCVHAWIWRKSKSGQKVKKNCNHPSRAIQHNNCVTSAVLLYVCLHILFTVFSQVWFYYVYTACRFYLLFFSSIECLQGDDLKGTGKSVSADVSGTEPDEILREFGISPVSGITLFAAWSFN